MAIRILIIEDAPLIRENLVALLTYEHFEVSSAANGMDGLALALRERPDLILCDVNLPLMDGFEVVQQLRENEQTAPISVIFISSNSGYEEYQRGMALGAMKYLTKPFANQELLSIIVAVLQQRK